MAGGYQALTEKEKQTLRLLVDGYDAKSMARYLGLSVHTINERLRDARRKMSTSSSREAARMVRAVEEQGHELLGDNELGDAARPQAAQFTLHPGQRSGTVPWAGWMIGGVVMTTAIAILAAVALASGGASDSGAAKEIPAAVDASQQRAEQAARQFLVLVDARNWQASYAATGDQFRKGNTLEGWSKAAQGAHGVLGPAVSRELLTADYSPAPPNGVWNIRFRSRFADGREVVESLAMAYENGSWRVVGLLLH
jgi:DNA-binding CsgD family transcriptional regulator